MIPILIWHKHPPLLSSTPIPLGQGACLSRISAAIFQQQRRPTRMQNVPIGDIIHLATMASCSNSLPIRCLESGSIIPNGKTKASCFFHNVIKSQIHRQQAKIKRWQMSMACPTLLSKITSICWKYKAGKHVSQQSQRSFLAVRWNCATEINADLTWISIPLANKKPKGRWVCCAAPLPRLWKFPLGRQCDKEKNTGQSEGIEKKMLFACMMLQCLKTMSNFANMSDTKKRTCERP